MQGIGFLVFVIFMVVVYVLVHHFPFGRNRVIYMKNLPDEDRKKMVDKLEYESVKFNWDYNSGDIYDRYVEHDIIFRFYKEADAVAFKMEYL